jgi:hypothetical protein
MKFKLSKTFLIIIPLAVCFCGCSKFGHIFKGSKVIDALLIVLVVGTLLWTLYFFSNRKKK